MTGLWRIAVLCLAVGMAVPAAAGHGRNQLAGQSSPYLRLHADDLVHWRTWGADALDEAKAADRPILLSIGYSACHWCHVMRRESFTDAETAEIINSLFLPVLIDREERPDLDSQYQVAAMVMGLPTGWPLTLFLTPSGRPFWGGVYFPKEPVAGLPSFKRVLRTVAETYEAESEAVHGDAAKVATVLRMLSMPRPGTVSVAEVDAVAAYLLGEVDTFMGGFGDEAKHPNTPALELLWRAFLRTGDGAYAAAVTATLEQMVIGGLYDHVGGGFFRYTVDPRWRVPHFEKMLDVNAAVLRLMTETWRETRDPDVERAVRGSVAFLLDEMRLAGGAFAGSLDADSRDSSGEEREGAFYTWSATEVRRLLGNRAQGFLDAFGIEPIEGEYLDSPDQAGTLYRKAGIETAALSAALTTLRNARAARSRPRRDSKVLADWNAMTVTALAEAAMAFGEPAWLDAARRAFAAATEVLVGTDGRLAHSWHDGVRGAPATVADYAMLAGAAVTLFEATGDTAYLRRAGRWADAAVADHWDDRHGGFYASASDAGPLLVRAKPVIDSPNPSGNAAMVDTLARLYYLTGDAARRDVAERTVAAFGGMASPPSFGVAGLVNAAETLRTALQVVVIGRRGDAGTDALIATVTGRSLPTRVLQVVAPGTTLPEGHPARGKGQEDGRATVYVCRGTFCSLPATDADTLADTLITMRRAG